MATFSKKQLLFFFILSLYNSIIECSLPKSNSYSPITTSEKLTSLNDSWHNNQEEQKDSSKEKTEQVYINNSLYQSHESCAECCKCVSCLICGCGCGALLGYVLSLGRKSHGTIAPSLSPIQAPSSSPIQAPRIFNPINQINPYAPKINHLRLINQPKNSNPPFASLPDTTNVKAKTI